MVDSTRQSEIAPVQRESVRARYGRGVIGMVMGGCDWPGPHGPEGPMLPLRIEPPHPQPPHMQPSVPYIMVVKPFHLTGREMSHLTPRCIDEVPRR